MTNPREHAHHPHHAEPGEATDSAEVPWAQRELSPSGFETDDGAADPTLRALLADPDTSDLDLMRAVEGARLLVPIVAEPVEVEHSGSLTVDSRVDLAAVTLVAPDGARALPVFSGVDALAAWDSAARPVPVTPARAGQAAVAEGADTIVIDLAGPNARALRPSMVWALAQQRPWLPAHEDPFVARSVAAAVRTEEAIADHAIEEGTPVGEGVLGIVLGMDPRTSPEQVRGVATRVGEQLSLIHI